jgi:hypothetical protein
VRAACLKGAQQRTLVGADKFAPHAHTPDNTIVSSGSQSELGLAMWLRPMVFAMEAHGLEMIKIVVLDA